MDSLVANGRALPYYASIPATLLALAMLFVALRSSQGRATRFVIFAIWLRFILSAFHPITFSSSPIGLSYNALGSIFICGLGAWVLKPRGMFDVGLVPFYPILLAVILSGFANHSVSPMVDMTVKYLYLAIITLAVSESLQDDGWDEPLRKVFLPFLILVGFQALSVLLGTVKAAESDGSASYIGGFYHEAGFSVALAGGLLVVCLRRRQVALYKVAWVLVFCVAIMLANYRTAILAMAPLIGATALIGAARSVIREQRVIVVGMMAAIVLAVGVGGAIAGRERFADLGAVAAQGTELIKRPDQFNLDERHLLSGRFVIWSGYLYGYSDSTPLQHIVGLGPNAWIGKFKVYAHNTLVSAIYELGIFGLISTVFLWIWMLVLAIKSPKGVRGILVSAHISFIILNMATMPLWMIEGMIYYGILCGATIAAFKAGRPQSRKILKQPAV
ncbi:O-antigen ligase family protein [Sphingomonas sp. Leaf20]|jgi:hypothetical protein|uniref:O-antigen ligase family protein n=1 Tax=Sphingomonas sp. Leaf20 TaxID=1735685 RepID=UPI000B1DC1DF|nr:hypothetical protein [Sphingomonas sp. Leaf20]